MLAYLKWIVAEQKAIASLVIMLLGISGISLYGNVNEFNPWKPAEEVELTPQEVAKEDAVKAVATEVIRVEKIIERVVSGVTQEDIEKRMAAHIEEFH